jgi:hypothetical protein
MSPAYKPCLSFWLKFFGTTSSWYTQHWALEVRRGGGVAVEWVHCHRIEKRLK